MTLAIEDVQVRISGRAIVSGASLIAAPGEVSGVIGPNGSGKSTLLRTAFRHLKPHAGRVLLDSTDIASLRPGDLARRIGAVPQETRSDFDITVREMVTMGRTPHKHPFAAMTATDHEIIDDALSKTDTRELAERRYATLSGGERQRVLLARALAQRTAVLVLDEPTNHLDVRHQLDLMLLVRELGLTTLMAVHDLNLAAGHCDRLHVLSGGRIVASGKPAEVLTTDLVREVFEVDADVVEHPRTGVPHLILSPLDEP
ncbi:ABC transporter ATP-binding protein [Amycolatopsis sp. CA-230715]|uniref:ABC transporter ATP-binding protein n=1 Tax=Amycolatopsis sp. CA-230715 TaxID=2745196 RepID=UPI001C0345C5|nr:ABC transporter ATP-binding protein [Amycolatopsis sp. CA-230715]QWF78830.1 Fe(3+) dicitrate transport ATP-binding protein FecE [Amycolatopsis sp. CA-230715]